MDFKTLSDTEVKSALELAWDVFQKYEAPDYSEEGMNTFHGCLKDADFTSMLKCYGAFDGTKIVGMIATRSEGTHIALFFVNGSYHKHGIGKKLFSMACADNKSGTFTVNSSPYATEVYHHLGFIDTDTQKVQDGLIFTPMVCKFK
ncbi:hypothetical protein SDC9_62113 [bioreactor metagenome]|uniref:N-acetyltransferase domain-containing protein n=1 Tax=bioreactor metagenome TaxID=1076179 RepID=A0A644XIY3_9ZZZZ|nr:GNAT family N-acetyltransferase [Candidatus Metalachnospira sp.]